MDASLGRRLTAEATGTGLLVAVVVGSGIAAQRLSPGDPGLQLLANSVATAAGLVALVLAFAPVSGAHLNPVVTLAARLEGRATTGESLAYAGVQVGGACVGAMVANVMFDLAPVTLSGDVRSSTGVWLGEVVATFGLLTVVLGVTRSGRVEAVAIAVGAYIGAAYWFTSSTSFANPAVTVGRTLTDTFAGIAPSSVPAFLVAQLAGGLLAVALGALPPTRAARPPRRAARPVRSRRPRPTRSRPVTSTSDDSTGAGRRGVGPVVVFLCVHNAGRSQMALGWFTHLAGRRAHGLSGGSEPAAEVNPVAVQAMAEVGIDISAETPRAWTDEVVRAADVVVTMGCGDTCPYFPGTRYEDWPLDDPAGQGLEAVRPIRDEIERRVRALLASLGIDA